MTPREFYREQEAATEQWRYESEQRLVQAWYIAALTRAEKMPKLEELVSRPKRRQTPAELRAVLYLMSERTGIPVIES